METEINKINTKGNTHFGMLSWLMFIADRAKGTTGIKYLPCRF